MPNAIPGLRSCYDKVGRLIYFGRMLDKIRLHAAGQLPPEYQETSATLNRLRLMDAAADSSASPTPSSRSAPSLAAPTKPF
jgi:hypothetical protein